METSVWHRIRTLRDRDHGIGATDEEIARAEAALGIPIRGGYRAFLKQFGWGGGNHLQLFGLGQDVPKYLDLVLVTLSERREMTPALRDGLLPFYNDGGGNLCCIDTAGTEPVVVFWDHTIGVDQALVEEARDFETWLGRELDALSQVAGEDA